MRLLRWRLDPLFKIALFLAFYSWLSLSNVFVHFILFSIFILKLYAYKGSIRSVRKHKYTRKDTGRPPAPFSVSIHHAIFEKHNIVLSAIRIALPFCSPEIQALQKLYHFTKHNQRLVKSHQRKHNPCAWIRRNFILACILTHQTTVHALPGTNHVLVSGEQSLNTNRQIQYVNTVMSTLAHDSTTDTNHQHTDPPPEAHPSIGSKLSSALKNNLPQVLYCFIADTDSILYAIDTAANRIIVNNANYITELVPTTNKIKGIGGNCVRIAGTGKLCLPLKSDDGTVTIIPDIDAVYVPSSPCNLIPPQILITQMKLQGFDIKYFHHNELQYVLNYTKPEGVSSHTLTIPISKNGLFHLRTNEGYTHFMSRAAHYLPDFLNFAGAAHIIEDDESTNSITSSTCNTSSLHNKTRESYETPPLLPVKTREPSPTHHTPWFLTSSQTREPSTSPSTSNQHRPSHTSTSVPHTFDDCTPVKNKPIPSPFSSADFCQPITEDESIAATRRKQFRLMSYHECLGHLSFGTLQLMARCNLIPKDLATVQPPTCPGCAYGKAHRRPWRHKGITNINRIHPATMPGQCVSVDQLVSPTPGLVPTHRGRPTLKRYIGATVFVDHYSDFTYIHLMVEMNKETTVEAKEAFERVAEEYNVRIRYYHCDNGLFDTFLFKSSITKAHQSITFCGVNAHHQNGKAERRIKDVTEGGRTSLLHASHRWPKAINASLWPMALKHYVNLRNNLPSNYKPGVKRGRRKLPDTFIDSPLSKFSGMEVKVNLRHFHPFGSPVYVLEQKLQAQQSHNKWSDRSRVGIFLTHSPVHSSSVPLVLNTSTGNVSPQFHCLCDDKFATCRRDAKFQSVWYVKAKLDCPTTPVTHLSSSTSHVTFPTT